MATTPQVYEGTEVAVVAPATHRLLTRAPGVSGFRKVNALWYRAAMPLDMAIEKLDPNSAVLTITGALTLGTNLKILDDNVQRLIGGGVTRMVLDLSSCFYSDSAGLGFLIHTYGMINEKGGSIRMCGVGERILELLKMTKTEDIIPLDADRQESIARL